jgi:hypothetical protein
MNEWDQRIREHRVWTEMKTLGPAIDDAFKVDLISRQSSRNSLKLLPINKANFQRLKKRVEKNLLRHYARRNRI